MARKPVLYMYLRIEYSHFCDTLGGACFIGAHIVRLLERANIDVTVLDNLSSWKCANLSE